MSKLVLIYGLPGSGKTTLARKICNDEWENVKVSSGTEFVEADQFFEDSNGNYNFNPKKLGLAHKYCEEKVEDLLSKGKDVIVSNTCLNLKERSIFYDMALEYKSELIVIQLLPSNEIKSIHNVPEENMKRMKSKMMSMDYSEKMCWNFSKVIVAKVENGKLNIISEETNI